MDATFVSQSLDLILQLLLLISFIWRIYQKEVGKIYKSVLRREGQN